ncbi:General negative regulator of transcription subunit 3 [Wickerhamiella sorbophila]|uniref:General negative regulator of transcription subunit n=1 Tax=Wickerhamiella sorbophila TaxID=45607 RepID=A0A2T0FMG3_9ASCO|nr:General negative regulator of transcription subunit 3 [Wickerhamiella sorbophila]PRT56183.1 General negative regulator of transcription subunit 3 [Wickerhamiella sorbophila]
MSARKLQQEMERVFKRVAEGVVVFDNIYDKLQMASTHNQKEKLEQDLKREVKKLQKFRDQIKTWIGSNDVRDKKQLIEQRKLIETEMERFKVVEREVKTKTYTLEGDEEPLDPHEQAKRDAVDFFEGVQSQLEEQIEQLESEEESLQGSMKRGKKDNAKQERISEIDYTVERHKWHNAKIDIIVRMIENDTLAPESAMALEDDIMYYVESNQDADFAEDDQMYDDLNLIEDEEDEELVETIVRDDTYTLEDLAQDLSKEAQAAKEREKEEKDKTVSTVSSAGSLVQPPASSGTMPMPAPVARVASGVNVAAPPVAPQSSGTPIKRMMSPAVDAKLAQGLSPLPPPGVKVAAPVAGTSAGSTISAPSKPPGLREASPAPSLGQSSTPSPVPQVAPTPVGGVAVSSLPSLPSASPSTSKPADAFAVNLPAGLEDLSGAFDAATQRVCQAPSLSSISRLVEASYMNFPDSTMADRPDYYHPESPYPTPEYYPSEVLPTLGNPAIFTKMDVDTLFYIFYYRQGTYQQYLAAKELKARSWRFHKKFLTWFQRHEEPETINSKFEQGTYRFFDFEGSWLQRRKSNFKFEYEYLEDEVV